MHVFTSVYNGGVDDARSADKEEVEWSDLTILPSNVLSNLRWLVPLALDKIRNQEFGSFAVKYR